MAGGGGISVERTAGDYNFTTMSMLLLTQVHATFNTTISMLLLTQHQRQLICYMSLI